MTHAISIAPSRGPTGEEIVDVWSRTSPKYRVRAALLLLATILLFAGLCLFTYWLRTGLYGPLEDWQYYRDLMSRSFDPKGSDQITLVHFLLFPISVEQVPMQWVIVGLLLASLSSIPILVAILYRFPASVIFALMVGLLAAMPWLGLTVLLGCAIASVKPFRLSFRYASALLGLIPVAIYFVSATRMPENSFLGTPYRAKLAAPWVLASLGSCVICAIALGTAKLINYRPGGIAPLLALLFAIPVILFHSQVGRDELEYRILESRLGPGSEYVFVNRSLEDEARRAATNAMAIQRDVDFDVLRARLLDDLKAAALDEESRDRANVIARCDDFNDRFKESRYRPNVLFLRGRAQDARIDRALLDQGLLQYHFDVPGPVSRVTWKQLEDNFPQSELSAHALLMLALLDARDGRLDSATQFLDRLIQRFGRVVTASRPTASPLPATIFDKPPPSRSLGFDPAVVVTPARRLRELIASTRDDPAFGDAPLRALLAFYPCDPQYGFNLAALPIDYPTALIVPAVMVRLSMMQSSPAQAIDGLRGATALAAGSICQAEPIYFLGQALQDSGQLADAHRVFEDLLRRYPRSCYADDATGRLTALAVLAVVHDAPEAAP